MKRAGETAFLKEEHINWLPNASGQFLKHVQRSNVRLREGAFIELGIHTHAHIHNNK